MSGPETLQHWTEKIPTQPTPPGFEPGSHDAETSMLPTRQRGTSDTHQGIDMALMAE